MPGARSLAEALPPLLPLRIVAVEYADPMLTVIGVGWSLALVGDWAWRRDCQVVTCWGDIGTEDAVWDLCGCDLTAVTFPDSRIDGDCIFTLSDGFLDARSDRTGWETWTFRHDDLDMVFVGL